MNPERRWSLGLLVGGAVGVAVHQFLVADVALALSLSFVWTVGVALGVRLNRYQSGDGRYATARWSGLGTLVMAVPALFGLLSAPVSDDLRFALGLLLLGTGFAGMQVCVALMVQSKAIVSSGDGSHGDGRKSHGGDKLRPGDEPRGSAKSNSSGESSGELPP